MWRNVQVCRPSRSTSGGQSSGSEGASARAAAAAMPLAAAAVPDPDDADCPPPAAPPEPAEAAALFFLGRFAKERKAVQLYRTPSSVSNQKTHTLDWLVQPDSPGTVCRSDRGPSQAAETPWRLSRRCRPCCCVDAKALRSAGSGYVPAASTFDV